MCSRRRAENDHMRPFMRRPQLWQRCHWAKCWCRRDGGSLAEKHVAFRAKDTNPLSLHRSPIPDPHSRGTLHANMRDDPELVADAENRARGEDVVVALLDPVQQAYATEEGHRELAAK